MLIAQWKSDAGVALDGSLVSQWDDQVGSFNLMQALGTNQPEFVANAHNGNPDNTLYYVRCVGHVKRPADFNF